MSKSLSTSQIRYETVNDIRAARDLLAADATPQEIAKHFSWGIRRAKRCITNFLTEQKLLALQESRNFRQNRPETTENSPKWTHPASYYFEELRLILRPGVVNSLIIVEATPNISEPFFRNITAFGNQIGAQFIAGARSSYREKIKDFPEFIRDYVIFQRIRVSDDLLIITDPGKSRSASDPLTHLLKMNGGKNIVVCHPRVAHQSIARMACDLPQHAWSTGTISPPDYDETSASGQDALRTAQCQALLIEIDTDGTVFFHQLKAEEDGSFQHLDWYVHKEVVYGGARAEVVHWADGHTEVMSPSVAAASFGWDPLSKAKLERPCLLDRLQPAYQYFDDLLNNTWRNKFSMSSTELARQYHLGQGSVRQELIDTASFINACRRPWTTLRKVEDNHGARLIEWLEGDRRKDPLPDNTMFWAEMLVAKHQMLKDDPEDFRLAYLEHEAFLKCGMSDDIEFIYRGTSSKVAGVEHGIHFHKGVNGSPGRASQFKALGYPIVGGHPHTPSIDDGVVTVGTCSDLKERWDPDSTTKAHGHAIQYPNGHVVLCLMHPDGRYEAAGPRASLELAA